jgi:hypothetical protein
MIYASAVTLAMLRRKRQLADDMMRRRTQERGGKPPPAAYYGREYRYPPNYWRFIANEFRLFAGVLGRVACRVRGR